MTGAKLDAIGVANALVNKDGYPMGTSLLTAAIRVVRHEAVVDRALADAQGPAHPVTHRKRPVPTRATLATTPQFSGAGERGAAKVGGRIVAIVSEVAIAAGLESLLSSRKLSKMVGDPVAAGVLKPVENAAAGLMDTAGVHVTDAVAGSAGVAMLAVGGTAAVAALSLTHDAVIDTKEARARAVIDYKDPLIKTAMDTVQTFLDRAVAPDDGKKPTAKELVEAVAADIEGTPPKGISRTEVLIGKGLEDIKKQSQDLSALDKKLGHPGIGRDL